MRKDLAFCRTPKCKRIGAPPKTQLGINVAATEEDFFSSWA